jgi:hypothetical protein
MNVIGKTQFFTFIFVYIFKIKKSKKYILKNILLEKPSYFGYCWRTKMSKAENLEGKYYFG